MSDEERIRRRAHEIWESEGQPEGRHEEHWTQAHREVEQEQAGSQPEPTEPDANPAGSVPPGSAGPKRAKRGASPPPDAAASEAARIID